MQQIYGRTPMPKRVFSCKFAVNFQNTFSLEHWTAVSEYYHYFQLTITDNS